MINPTPAEHWYTQPLQTVLASETNWSGSALSAIKYVNL